MRKVVVFTLLLLACFLLALWSPWMYWRFDFASLFGVQRPETIAGLQVFSLSGELEIFIDGEFKGKVKPEDKSFTVDRITPGERLVTIKKISEIENSYWVFNKVILFEGGVNAVISYNLGPREEFSEGHVIYATKKIDSSKQTQLNVKFNVENVIWQMNTEVPITVQGNTYSTSISLEKQHTVSIAKAGYETLEFSILPDTQEDRDKFKNYDIEMEVQLFMQPLDVIFK